MHANFMRQAIKDKLYENRLKIEILYYQKTSFNPIRKILCQSFELIVIIACFDFSNIRRVTYLYFFSLLVN